MTQPEAVAPDQWGEGVAVEFRVTMPWRKAGCEGWRVRDANKRIRLGEYDAVEVRYSDGRTATFSAAPDTVSDAEQVGTSKASEPQNNPHPGRGEGELLPCPFCGSAAYRQGRSVCCTNCSAERKSVEAWNRRAPNTYGKGGREELLSALGDAVAALASISGLSQAATKVGVQALQLGRE